MTSAPVPGYRGLRVWQHALDLTVDAALLARALELDGLGPLAADLVRAGLAVPAHIAAGSVAPTRADHQRALAAALAALARFETVLAAAERLAPRPAAGAPDAYAALLAGAHDVSRSLRSLARVIGGAPPAAARAAVAEAPPSPAPPPAADLTPPMPARPARQRRPRAPGAATTGAAPADA